MLLNLTIQDKSFATQLFYLILIVIACTSVFSGLALLIITTAGLNIETLKTGDLSSISYVDLQWFKLSQLISTMGLFIAPALIFAWLKNNNFTYLQMFKINPKMAVLATLITIVAMPAMGYCMQINQSIHLPNFLSDLESLLRSQENDAENMTQVFLQMPSVIDLIINLFVIAIAPAIAEELLFRGIVQRFIFEVTQKPHLSIWLAAALFSFIHFQFFGFLPRMLIGALLGYLYYWSGNLWYSIIAHFINNGVQVIAVYVSGAVPSTKGLDTPEIPWHLALISVALVIALSNQYYKKSKQLINN